MAAEDEVVQNEEKNAGVAEKCEQDEDGEDRSYEHRSRIGVM